MKHFKFKEAICLFLFISLLGCGCGKSSTPAGTDVYDEVNDIIQSVEDTSQNVTSTDTVNSPQETAPTPTIDAAYGTDSFDVVDAATAQDYVSQMGIGWNLGNSFDSTNCTWLTNDLEYETGWGNPPVTKELISYIKTQGFNTIRIPVTWSDHMDENYIINEAWMDRIQEVVDWCLEEDLFVIINIHHEDSWLPKASTDYDNVMLKYCTIWAQIANRFGAYNEKLIFESMNEIGFQDLNTEEGCTLLSKMNEEFTNLIRTSGQNNVRRYLILAGYWTDIDSSCSEAFTLPADDRIILSVHYYAPAEFTFSDATAGENYRRTWGTDADFAILEGQFQKLQNHFINNGIPVIIGEFSVILKDKDENSRILWFESVCNTALKYNCCPIVWDNGEIIDRNNLTWKTSQLKHALFFNTK